MNIYLLQGGEIFWQVVEVYLRGINASAFVLSRDDGFQAPENKKPDLLITGRKSLGHPAFPTMRAPVIVIDEEAESAPAHATPGRGETVVLRWPFTRRQFLEATAGALGLEPRKDFRALIRVGTSRSDFGTLAESRDFSLSGMSFKSPTYFTHGLKIAISLSLPGDGRHLILDCRVVRSFTDEADGSVVYGVEFRHLAPETRDLLKEFILS